MRSEAERIAKDRNCWNACWQSRLGWIAAFMPASLFFEKPSELRLPDGPKLAGPTSAVVWYRPPDTLAFSPGTLVGRVIWKLRISP